MCNGDSGGPLILRDRESDGDVQVGINAYGAACESFPYPNGFMRVSYYYDWIQEQICLHSDDPPANCPEVDDVVEMDEVRVNVTIQVSTWVWNALLPLVSSSFC